LIRAGRPNDSDELPQRDGQSEANQPNESGVASPNVGRSPGVGDCLILVRKCEKDVLVYKGEVATEHNNPQLTWMNVSNNSTTRKGDEEGDFGEWLLPQTTQHGM
jgi:hypothetical protein